MYKLNVALVERALLKGKITAETSLKESRLGNHVRRTQ